MSNRLNKDREEKLQPKRIEYAIQEFTNRGVVILSKSNVFVTISYKGSPIIFYPYSGWFSGKTIKDGRGIDNLLKQICNGK